MRTAGNCTDFMARQCECPRHVTADRPGAEYADLHSSLLCGSSVLSSATGRQLGLSLTSVNSQLMALEEVLGTTLVERTTRHLSLTESGRLYYERAKQILGEVAEMEPGLTTQTGVASGRLHVSAPSLLGRLRLAPMLPGFLAEQTQVSVDLMLVDRPVRLAEEGIDVALRIGPLEDSGLIVRKLDDIQLFVCAAPDYLRRRGEPATPDDLVEQDCLTFGDG